MQYGHFCFTKALSSSLFFALKLEQLSVDFITDFQRSCTIHPVIASIPCNWCKILLVPLYFGDSLSMIPEASSFGCRHLWSTLVFHIVGFAVNSVEVKTLLLSVVHWLYFSGNIKLNSPQRVFRQNTGTSPEKRQPEKKSSSFLHWDKHLHKTWLPFLPLI